MEAIFVMLGAASVFAVAVGYLAVTRGVKRIKNDEEEGGQE